MPSKRGERWIQIGPWIAPGGDPNGIKERSQPWIASGEKQTVYKSIAIWNPWTGLWKSDQLQMVLLRVGTRGASVGGAWKLQPGELERFKKGSFKASKRVV